MDIIRQHLNLMADIQRNFARGYAESMKPLVELPKNLAIALSPSITQLNQSMVEMSKMLKGFNRQRENAMRSIHFDLLNDILERTKQAARLQIVVPESLFEKLNDTVDAFEPLLSEEEKENAIQQITNNYYITVNASQPESPKINYWNIFFGFMAFLIPFLYQVYSDHRDDLEKKQDRMIQEQQFNVFIEKFNDLIDSVHPVVSEPSGEVLSQDPRSSE